MPPFQGPIYRDIEGRAKYHSPDTYDLLGFHNSMFETTADPLAPEYIPLTGAKLPNRTEVLPFVIGVIPPSAVVTGNLLDRSMTVAAEAGKAISPGYVGPLGSGNTSGEGQAAVVDDGSRHISQSGLDFIIKHEGVRKEIYNDSAGNPTIGVGHLVLPEEMDRFKNGISDDEVKALLQKDIQRFEAKVNQQIQVPLNDNEYAVLVSLAFNTGNLNSVRDKLNKDKDYEGVPPILAQIVKQKNRKTGEVTVSQGLVNRRNDEIKLWKTPTPGGNKRTVSANRSGGAVAKDVGGKPPGWQKQGSGNAKTAVKAEVAKADKNLSKADLNKRQLGNVLQAAQKNVIRALQLSIEQMANTPPLRMLINPESFSVAAQKIISDGNWGRNGAGVGIEHWGDGQDTISASGRIAGFYAMDAMGSGANGSPGNSPGLSRTARAFSASYQNFLSLYLIYRNNGGIWLEDFADAKDTKTTKPNNLALVGTVYIYYDNTLYLGSFNSFEMSEEDTAPFTLSYSFEFTVRAAYLLDRVGNDNPRPDTTYGLPAIFGTTAPGAPMAATTVAISPAAGQPVPLPADTTVSPVGSEIFNAPLFEPGGLQLSSAPKISTTGEFIPSTTPLSKWANR